MKWVRISPVFVDCCDAAVRHNNSFLSVHSCSSPAASNLDVSWKAHPTRGYHACSYEPSHPPNSELDPKRVACSRRWDPSMGHLCPPVATHHNPGEGRIAIYYPSLKSKETKDFKIPDSSGSSGQETRHT